ncbi:MAG: signal peptidase II [Anaerovibrio sp.]|uniref:signal peptidase II n=1 Tax=Anaerovibrio sp. TaxID=1872532 RepID=UPI0025D865AD|nr:signal peptidase II [Anaerovibrio sp.]MCR5175964.1 signal peptidase II [Anaerovibrio sp.]
MTKLYSDIKSVPLGLGILIFVLDQLAKGYVTASMHLGQSVPVVDDFFYITYVLNPGAAFGLFEHQRLIFILVALLLLGLAVYFRKQLVQETVLIQYGVGLLLGGAVGNLYDRLQSGLVVDFFDFRFWPVFNIADVAICLGAGFVMFDMLFRRDGDDTEAQG